MHVLPDPAGSSRKEQVLAIITDRLTETGGASPSMGEIAARLRISETRVRALIDRLVAEGKVERLTGAKRGLTIPGLARAIAIATLRAEGWIVDGDARLIAPPLAYPHLPMPRALDYLPGIEEGGETADGDGSEDDRERDRGGGAGTPARGAPGARPAATEDEDRRAA